MCGACDGHRRSVSMWPMVRVLFLCLFSPPSIVQRSGGGGRILKASYMYVLLYVHTCMRMYTLLCIYVCTVYALYTCVVCVWCCVYCHSETTAHLMVLGVLSDHITEQ